MYYRRYSLLTCLIKDWSTNISACSYYEVGLIFLNDFFASYLNLYLMLYVQYYVTLLFCG